MRNSSLAKYQRYYRSYDHDILESMSLKKTIDNVIMDRDRSMKARQTGRGTYSPTLSEDAPQVLKSIANCKFDPSYGPTVIGQATKKIKGQSEIFKSSYG